MLRELIACLLLVNALAMPNGVTGNGDTLQTLSNEMELQRSDISKLNILLELPQLRAAVADKRLEDVTSKAVMESNGWRTINVKNTEGYDSQCGTATFYGFGRSPTRVSATFNGVGKATLRFGNCFSSGTVHAYLNDAQISSAAANVKNKLVTFQYGPGDTIKLTNDGIMKINSLKLSPTI